MPEYRALVGIDYPGDRVEAGDVTDGLPAKSIKWLLDQGLVEDAAKPTVPPAVTPEIKEG